MPYLNCPNCRLTVYSAAFYSTAEECPRCTTRLGRPSRLFRTPLPHRLESDAEIYELGRSLSRENRSATA